MNFSKEQKDYIIHALEHCEVLTGGRSSGKTLELIKQQEKEIERLHSIIKEVREYITSYESISIMQGLMNEYSNYDLDIKTMNEMIRRYMVVHDKLLEILDKENK